MEKLDKLKDLFRPVLDECGVSLYELSWNGKEKTLQLSIIRPDGTMDLDTCCDVSEKISELLRLAHIFFGDGIFVTQTLVPRFSCDLIFIL